MTANYYGMYQQLDDYVRRYEHRRNEQQRQSGEDPYEAMLDILQAPYNALRNYDEFLRGLKEQLSAEEAEVWRAYPDYTLTTVPRTPDEARRNVRPELHARLEALTRSLADKGFLFEDAAPSGGMGYMRNYLFGLVNEMICRPNGTILSEACLHWWMDIVDGGDSAKLREMYPEYRVVPHEGTITGEAKHGRIPMNLQIPDTREVIPSIDQMEVLLSKCRRFAVVDCMCRVAQDRAHKRECSFPVEGVCLEFDAVAESEIAAGTAKEITRREALDIIRRCRDLGMVQIISNAEHPLCVCNCCKCCCVCMRSLERYEDTVCEVSRYAADAAARENCVGCGSCARMCVMEAVSIVNGKVQIASQKCIGCGLCVSRCPKAVLRMVKRPGAIDRVAQTDLQRVYL